MNKTWQRKLVTATLLLLAGSAWADDDDRAKLIGFAVLAADTFAEGPPAGGDRGDGNPIDANGRTGPFPGQPVQGFSGVQFAPGASGSFWFLSDNGFGNKVNSSDYLLRIYQVDPDFRTRKKGSAGVEVEGFVQLRDPNHRIPYDIINEGTQDRLLTGSDFDIESFVIDRRGDIWVGDEFGPFILHFDSSGVLLEAPIRTPDLNPGGGLSATREVRSPDNPFLDGDDPNLNRSRGYEGMAFSPNRKKAYPLLEGSVTGDPTGALRIYEFNLQRGAFQRFVGFYPQSIPGQPIGDFTPINDHEFLVIERDGGQGATAEFKKIFKVDLRKIDADGFVEKELVVDLLDIRDPFDLNRDGSRSFDFPFVTIEDVLVLDEETILVANDNNYPFSQGRDPVEIDNNEIIVLRLEEDLDLDDRLGLGDDDEDDDDDDDDKDDD